MLTVNGPINLHCTHTKSQTQTLIATLTVNGPLELELVLEVLELDSLAFCHFKKPLLSSSNV